MLCILAAGLADRMEDPICFSTAATIGTTNCMSSQILYVLGYMPLHCSIAAGRKQAATQLRSTSPKSNMLESIWISAKTTKV